ncbi:MAG TPA: DUF4390 domain-containing protein [Spirochaetota bacterium]|nr:MAG: hypothetical protein BWY96_02160 [Spirochaetes bacterium ADurb.BinA120]HNU92515.1 DUF4390 domain-containing protein [Spirochaetota bacterium]HPV98218.1 DUF4390 domain-containing protein [Spirochaetota bacterium]
MKMTRKMLRFTALLAVFIPSWLYAAGLEFGPVRMTGDGMQVNLTVGSYQRHDIIEATKRGMELKVVYEIQIRRAAGGLFTGNRTVYSRMIVRKARFDFWGKAFQVMEGGRGMVFQGENAMLDYIFSLRDYELRNIGLKPGEAYVMRARAELKSVELYFPMNVIFKYLVGFWDFDTGWVNGPPVDY